MSASFLTRKGLPLLFLATLFVVSACKNRVTESPAAAMPADEVKVNPTGINQLEDRHWVDSCSFNRVRYHIDIQRLADSSLPEVVDENGVRFYDNRIELVVRRGETEVVKREFTKAMFDRFLNDELREHGVLAGVVYADSVKGGLHFVASVSYPDPTSDMYIPLSVVLDLHGGMTIKVDEEHLRADGLKEQGGDSDEVTDEDGV